MGLLAVKSLSTSSIAFTIMVFVLAILAYLLDLKRMANALLILCLIVWLVIPLVSLPFDTGVNYRHFLIIPTALILYFGRGNLKASFWGNISTGVAGLVSDLYPDKIEFLKKAGGKRVKPCPTDIDCETFALQDFHLELFSTKNSTKKKLIYGIHGASHITPLTNLYRKLNHRYVKLFPSTLIASVDPRSSLEHPYPATLNDVEVGYKHMLSLGFKEKDVVLLADSSGANLALALCHRLKASGLDLPSAMMLISPQTDLTRSGDSYVSRYHLDPILGNLSDQVEKVKRIPLTYAQGENLASPFISPLFGDLSGFPETLIQVGEYEVLYDDAHRLYEKMKQAGVNVHFSEFSGMVHSFQLMFSRLVPEVRHARDEIEAFLRKHLTD